MRRLTLAAVTAVHLFAIVWIDQTLRARKATSGKEPPPLIVFFLNTRPDEKKRPADPQQKTAVVRRVGPQRLQESQPAQPERLLNAPSPSNAITDWAQAARDAATAYEQRERAKAQLRSFDHRFSEPAEPEKPGVFGSQKRNARAGTVEPGVDNSERHWVTDDCYVEFKRGAPPPPPIAGDIKVSNPLRCKPPPTGGGEHMFDELKPDYQKRLPEPAR
jgi:hypothetical protein